MIFNQLVEDIHSQFGHLLSINRHLSNAERLEQHARAIHETGNAPLDNCFGFIDGTVRPVCRPMFMQKALYNGHKRTHALKYQSVTGADGLIIDLFGPVEGSRHDSYLLHESKLLERLEGIAETMTGAPLCLYGDLAYGITRFLISPFQGASLAPQQRDFNARMSAVRETVEYGFQRISTKFAFVDFKKNQKVMLQNVGMQYRVAAILVNVHACFYGTQTATYFDVETPTPEEYLGIPKE